MFELLWGCFKDYTALLPRSVVALKKKAMEVWIPY